VKEFLMSSKQAALDLAPAAIASTASTAKPPDKFTYALPAFTVQRRKTGWWISPTWSAGEKPQWSGPFATIESACLSIARKLAIEIADRHTQSIERHTLTAEAAMVGEDHQAAALQLVVVLHLLDQCLHQVDMPGRLAAAARY
jgi:hypothetical protein